MHSFKPRFESVLKDTPNPRPLKFCNFSSHSHYGAIPEGEQKLCAFKTQFQPTFQITYYVVSTTWYVSPMYLPYLSID